MRGIGLDLCLRALQIVLEITSPSTPLFNPGDLRNTSSLILAAVELMVLLEEPWSNPAGEPRWDFLEFHSLIKKIRFL